MTTQTYRRARHSVSALQAHLVLVTKYRRPVFTDEMLTFAENTTRTVCSDLDVELVEFTGETGQVGARFRGCNQHTALGTWETVCEVVEVEDQRRWVWNVFGPDGVGATWGFEVEPASDGALIRQWARLGPGPSGLSIAIAAQPDKEARIIAGRLSEWQKNMQANLDWIRRQIEG